MSKAASAGVGRVAVFGIPEGKALIDVEHGSPVK